MIVTADALLDDRQGPEEENSVFGVQSRQAAFPAPRWSRVRFGRHRAGKNTHQMLDPTVAEELPQLAAAHDLRPTQHGSVQGSA